MDWSEFFAFAWPVLQFSAFALCLSSVIAIIIYFVLGKLKFTDSSRNIAIAGTLVLVTAQLIGAFSGATFPILLGPDVSDYSISCNPVYLKIVIPDSLIDEEVSARLNHTSPKHYVFQDYLINISANNLNPLRKYNQQIYLESIDPPEFNTSIFFPSVLKIGESTKLSIFTRLNNLRRGQEYPIVIQGIGSDGKKRNCTIAIKVISEDE